MVTDKNHTDHGNKHRQGEEEISAEERVRNANERSHANEDEQAEQVHEEQSRVEGEVTGEERVGKYDETVRQGRNNPQTEAERKLEENAHQPERKSPKDDASMTGLPGFGGKMP